MMTKEIEHLLDFLNSSPTAFHAVDYLQNRFKKKGFEVLEEGKPWHLKPGLKYTVERNGSAIAAFILPKKKLQKVSLLASHLDSPGFKLRPNPLYTKEKNLMLALEIYGAPLLSSWLNRDLGLAGRVVIDTKKGREIRLINLSKPLAVIPQLAIHLDRQVNEKGLELNKNEHLNALIGLFEKSVTLEELLALPKNSLLAHDLFLYPIEKASQLGMNAEFISSGRLDNLASASASLEALLANSEPAQHCLKAAIFFDHEEIGSESKEGAASTFFNDLLKRIHLALNIGEDEAFSINAHSLCLSLDLTHATHPNYPEKHDPRHLVHLGQGPALKTSAQKRYATDSLSWAELESVARTAKVKLQHFSPRGDIPCGSTIGPIHSTKTALPTVDLGTPELSMHSARELMSISDHLKLLKLLNAFFE